MQQLSFFFDPISPFGYLAWRRLHNTLPPDEVEIEYIPIFLGTILKTLGIVAPINIKAKLEYNRKDFERWAELYSLRCCMPERLPNSLYAIKIYLAIEESSGKEKAFQFMDTVLDLTWLENQNTSSWNAFEPTVTKLGLSFKEVINLATSVEIKKLVKRNNERAMEEGVFGVPSFIVNDKLFWGNDRLDFVFKELNYKVAENQVAS